MADGHAKAAAIAGMAGGTLWALTPLRQPVLGAGRTPDEGELFFRGYNALLVLIALLLSGALLHLRHRAPIGAGRPFWFGWWAVLVGHVVLLAGSLLAVVLGGSLQHVVTMGQDAGFLGALLAALGAVVLGAAGYRRGILPKAVAALFVAALPLGLLGTVLLGAMGAPGDSIGLPLTMLYGGAWATLGIHWTSARDHGGSRSPDVDADPTTSSARH